jgi:hypothetical protein
MGVRQVRRCRTCGRKFTPRFQKLVLPMVPEQTVIGSDGDIDD